jgi:hypothetical protein
MLSCALIMIPRFVQSIYDCRTTPPAQEVSGCRGNLSGSERSDLKGHFRSDRIGTEASFPHLMQNALSARMRGAVDFEQPLGVDPGVNLGGRERGVAKQFLDRAQVAAAGQKVGGKGMPQGMWRRAIGQAQRAAQPFHGELNDSRAKRPAPTKTGPSGGSGCGHIAT